MAQRNAVRHSYLVYGNWWIHDSLHMQVGLDMNRLLYIEIAFHMTMLACAVVLAFSLMRLARHAAAVPPR